MVRDKIKRKMIRGQIETKHDRKKNNCEGQKEKKSWRSRQNCSLTFIGLRLCSHILSAKSKKEMGKKYLGFRVW